MSMHSISLDVASALAPPRTCPGCGSRELSPRSDEYGVTFSCRHCERTWTLDFGSLVPVGPERCPACGENGPCAAHAQVPRQREPS